MRVSSPKGVTSLYILTLEVYSYTRKDAALMYVNVKCKRDIIRVYFDVRYVSSTCTYISGRKSGPCVSMYHPERKTSIKKKRITQMDITKVSSLTNWQNISGNCFINGDRSIERKKGVELIRRLFVLNFYRWHVNPSIRARSLLQKTMYSCKIARDRTWKRYLENDILYRRRECIE